MQHYPNIIGAESKPLYFDQNEIFAQFSFLAQEEAAQPPYPSAAPVSTGSRKDVERIAVTRQACESVRKELEQEKQTFDSDRDNWMPSLLFDTGKTTKKRFLEAVEKRLGAKPHHDTAMEEWRKVPSNLKHKGRVQEQ
jgi:hypothetical protein